MLRKLTLIIFLQTFMNELYGSNLLNKFLNQTGIFPNKMHYVVIKENFGETEFLHFSHDVKENPVESAKNPVGSFSGRKETIMLTKSIINPLTGRNASIKDHITKFISNTNKNILSAFSLPSKIKKQAVKTINKVQSTGIKNNKTTKTQNAVAVNLGFFDNTSKKITKNILEFVNKFGWSKTSEKDKDGKDKLNSKPINITIKGTTELNKNISETSGNFTLMDEKEEFSPPIKINCSCGKPTTTRRTAGGYEAAIEKFPWNVRIFFKEFDNDICGGTIISNKYILTAAHCVMFIHPQELGVRVGHKDPDDPGEVAEIKSLRIHARYSVNRMGMFDIALIQLKKTLNFTEKILPVCLTNEQSYHNKRGVITSWGPISGAHNSSDTLRKASVRIIENHICKRRSDYNDEDLNSSVICAGIPEQACGGDSGSPLVHYDGNKFLMVGIKSWNVGCAEKRYPVIYTKVPMYYNWIKQRTKDSSYCTN